MKYTLQQARNILTLTKKMIGDDQTGVFVTINCEDTITLLAQALEKLASLFENPLIFIEAFEGCYKTFDISPYKIYQEKLSQDTKFKGKSLYDLNLTSGDWAALAWHVFTNIEILNRDNLKIVTAHHLFCHELKQLCKGAVSASHTLELSAHKEELISCFVKFMGQLVVIGENKQVQMIGKFLSMAHEAITDPLNHNKKPAIMHSITLAMLKCLNLERSLFDWGRSSPSQFEEEIYTSIFSYILESPTFNRGDILENLKGKQQDANSFDKSISQLRDIVWDKHVLIKTSLSPEKSHVMDDTVGIMSSMSTLSLKQESNSKPRGTESKHTAPPFIILKKPEKKLIECVDEECSIKSRLEESECEDSKGIFKIDIK